MYFVRTLLTFVLVSLTPSIYAQASETSAVYFFSRGVPGETDETKLALANAAEPIWYTTLRDSTLSEVVYETCGDLSPAVQSYFIRKALELNGLREPDPLIPQGFTVAVPFCHKITRNAKIYVTEGDYPERILKRVLGVSGPKSVQEFLKINFAPEARELTERQVHELSRKLPKNTYLTAPLAAEKRIFRRTSGKPGPIQIFQDNPPVGFQLAAATENISVAPDNYKYGVIVESIERITSEVAEPVCKKRFESEPVPFDHVSFLKRVEAELKFLAEKKIGIEPAVVGIIDSGLETVGKGLFEERFFNANKGETGERKEEGVDDDSNGFTDDVWGINFIEENGDIRHFGIGANPDHGTKIAAVSLGGPTSIRSWSDDIHPLSQLIVVNFADIHGNGMRPPHELRNAIDYLKGRDAHIVNISLSTKERLMPVFKAIIDTVNPLLYVVAAGNRQAGGKPLTSHARYPASFGGDQEFAENVVTVGALNNKNGLVDFSNYGKRVDLLAPGCDILSVNSRGEEVKVYGTSYAAALVTFAAGTIRALGGRTMRPFRIKERLIASSDMDKNLEKHVWTKGRLNLLKAVSLNHDVIEYRNNPDNPNYGHLDDVQRLRIYCKEEDKRKMLQDVRKVRPNLAGKTKKDTLIEYWAKPENKLVPIACTQTKGDIPITLRMEKEEKKLSLSELSDIVVASFR